MHLIENAYLRYFGVRNLSGPLELDRDLINCFLSAPPDPLPQFIGLPKLRRGRGKDHPRYGRWIYALAKFCRPEIVAEVGSFAGGTAVGWARAMTENRCGRLICIDNDTYSKGTYPELTRRNIEAAGLTGDRFELRCGDSAELVPALAGELKGRVDIFLVDGDHHYDAALADIDNGLPMIKPGGWLLVHDVDTKRPMNEQTPEHPHPVHEAFMKVVRERSLDWCILHFVRKHLALARIPG